MKIIIDVAPSDSGSICPVSYEFPEYVNDTSHVPQASCRCAKISTTAGGLLRCPVAFALPPDLASIFVLANPKPPAGMSAVPVRVSAPFVPSSEAATEGSDFNRPTIKVDLSAPSIRIGSLSPPHFTDRPEVSSGEDVRTLFGLGRIAWTLFQEQATRRTQVRDAETVLRYLNYSRAFYVQNGMMLADDKEKLIGWMDDHRNLLTKALGAERSISKDWDLDVKKFFRREVPLWQLRWSYRELGQGRGDWTQSEACVWLTSIRQFSADHSESVQHVLSSDLNLASRDVDYLQSRCSNKKTN